MTDKQEAAAIREENKYIGDLRKQFICATQNKQMNLRISAGQALGSMVKAWYRGRMLGKEEAYKIIKKKFPEAAKYLKERI